MDTLKLMIKRHHYKILCFSLLSEVDSELTKWGNRGWEVIDVQTFKGQLVYTLKLYVGVMEKIASKANKGIIIERGDQPDNIRFRKT